MTQEAPTMDPVSPLDYRYGRDEMKSIFSERGRLNAQLKVEGALAYTQGEMGIIPAEVGQRLEAAGRLAPDGPVIKERIDAIEDEIRHDIMALVKAFTEAVGADDGRFIHYGATSNDIIDTASGLQIKEGLTLLRKTLLEHLKELVTVSVRERDTVELGRTHGQPALPITFGLKVAVYADEMMRQIDRLDSLMTRVAVGKIRGAVGTGAGFGATAEELEKKVLGRLGLGVPLTTTQVIQRDNYLEMFTWMANVATTIEKMATEVRNLSRPEIVEVQEWFDIEKQVGSSTMAHKKNPISSENVCGLARVVRSYTLVAMENQPLWHERDLTNSSAERMILPHGFVLLDYIVARSARIWKRLLVHPHFMRRNLDATGGLILAERIMLVLTEEGMGRQEAHEVLRVASMKAAEEGTDLETALKGLPEVEGTLSPERITELMDPSTYTGRSGEIVDAVAEKARAYLG